MLRTILGLIIGAIVAVFVVFFGELMGHTVYPPPPGTDLSKPETLQTLIASLPLGAIIAVLIAWAAGAFLGGAVAARIARATWPAWLIGALTLAAGAYTMLQIPHPLWFQLAAIPATLIPAWLAGRGFGQ